jgi:hypothetical protein
MANRKSFRYFLLKLIFPFIYAAFFIVQQFINFDTALTRFSDRYQLLQCRNQSGHPLSLSKSKDTRPVKTKFRLHKNFQPSAIATLDDIKYEPDIRFISLQRVSYSNPFLENLLTDTRLLRGPPFIS